MKSLPTKSFLDEKTWPFPLTIKPCVYLLLLLLDMYVHIYTHTETKESHIYIVNEAQTLASQNVDRLMLLLHTGDFSSDLVLLFIYIRFHLKHTTRRERIKSLTLEKRSIV